MTSISRASQSAAPTSPGPGPSSAEREHPALPLRPGLAGLEPYGAPQIDVPVLLNVNENPYAPSDAVVHSISEAVAQAARSLNRYPDPEFAALRAELSRYLQAESGVRVAPDHLWAANGSNEVMLHILQAFGGPEHTAMSVAPTYSMYPEYARDSLTRWHIINRRADFSIDPAETIEEMRRVRPAVLLLASPNNPTGTALPKETITEILQAGATTGPERDGTATATVVVVDEAYGEFRRDGVPSALELLDHYPYLAVCRTMSKAFGMAGLRLGYVAAAPELIAHLRVVRLPYHLSAITQAAALAALGHREDLMSQVALLRQERDDLVQWLREQGLEVATSDANFILFGAFADRHAIWQDLVDRGVLIRETGPAGWLRVTVGTPEENRQLRSALQEVLAQHSARADSAAH